VGVVVGGTLVAVGGTCVCVGVTVGWLVGWTEAVAWLFAWIAVRVIATRLSWVGVVAWVGRVSGRTQAASELTRSITINKWASVSGSSYFSPRNKSVLYHMQARF